MAIPTPEPQLPDLQQVADYNQYGSPYPSHYDGSPAPQMMHSPYTYGESAYPDPGQMGQSYPTSTPGTTPSSPYTSTLVTARTTRSGRAIGSPSDALRPRPGGIQKTKAKPRGKKANSKKSDPVVFQALTTLLVDFKHVEEVDIDAYCHRSLEQRQREVRESKDHKVKRPMNAFILYRKAWQNRIKKWQTHENHQAISKVAGDGWAYESEEVKAQYAELARVEREMHTQAFPQYKFTPAKTKKARKSDVYSDGEESELETERLDWQTGPPPGAKRIYSSARLEDPNDPDWLPAGGRRAQYSSYHQPIQRSMSHSPYPQPPQMVMNQSHYQYSNPNTPMPRQYGIGPGHYQQQRLERYRGQLPQHASYAVPPPPYTVENAFYHASEGPSTSYPPHNSLHPSYRGSPVQPENVYHDYSPLHTAAPTPVPQHVLPPPPQHYDGDDFIVASSATPAFDDAYSNLDPHNDPYSFNLLDPALASNHSAFDADFNADISLDENPLSLGRSPTALGVGDEEWTREPLASDQNLDDVLKTSSTRRLAF